MGALLRIPWEVIRKRIPAGLMEGMGSLRRRVGCGDQRSATSTSPRADIEFPVNLAVDGTQRNSAPLLLPLADSAARARSGVRRAFADPCL